MRPVELLRDYSLEVTAKEINQIRKAAAIVPKGTQISIPFFPDEDFDLRVTAVEVVKELGLVPMPNVAGRRFRSRNELESYLERLGVSRVLVVAGDTSHPEGPFEDALSVIKSGVLQKHGIKEVGIAGYPSGHPSIERQTLRRSMIEKYATLIKLNLDCSIVTQFDFNPESTLSWLKEVRKDGITAPVRVGIAGPTEIERLKAFAKRCGVQPPGEYPEPNEILENLAMNYEPEIHGKMQLHFYPFGGVAKTGHWIQHFQTKQR